MTLAIINSYTYVLKIPVSFLSKSKNRVLNISSSITKSRPITQMKYEKYPEDDGWNMS